MVKVIRLVRREAETGYTTLNKILLVNFTVKSMFNVV